MFCQNAPPIIYSSVITAAAFGTLTTWGQVPLAGIAGTFSTYSVLNNGTVVASNLTTSTYTITGLGYNVQIGPVTVVPYDSSGVAGALFRVTGGSGGGKIYTWGQANTPTFSATTSTGTTLACTGTFSKAYVTFSGGTGTPASGTLINTVNSITQIYTGMLSNTSYIFNVYPVNGDGIPASATGTNVSTASVTTLPPIALWVAAGSVTNTLAYSTDGTTWVGLQKLVFSSNGYGVAYSASQIRWVAVGSGSGNTLAYSTNGTTWTGLGVSVFSILGYSVAYNSTQSKWVAGGAGTNTLAYSTNGTTWTGLGKSIFSSSVNGVAYGNNKWVAVGNGSGNTLAYSTNGTTWTGLGLLVFSGGIGYGVAYSATQSKWVAVGYGSHTLAYSNDGITWVGLGITTFTDYGYGVAYGNNKWVTVGSGLGNTLAYSTNGTTWTGIGLSVFNGGVGYGVAYSATQSKWFAVGNGSHTLAYSINGNTWTGLGTSIFNTSGAGIAVTS